MEPSAFAVGMEDRLLAIRERADRTYGTNELEDLLEDLLGYLVVNADHRMIAEGRLCELVLAGGGDPVTVLSSPGTIETLEFCMLALRWSRVEDALRSLIAAHPGEVGRPWDARRRAEQVLDSFRPESTTGELYRLYR
jgi:hypothetical protein